jgi:hypothetical protein
MGSDMAKVHFEGSLAVLGGCRFYEGSVEGKKKPGWGVGKIEPY